MRVAISGSSGLIGTALVDLLGQQGHEVVRLVRRQAGPGELRWDPDAGTVDRGGLEASDAVVHLAGENLAAGRWTDEQKRRIRESRTRGTRVLCTALAAMERKPQVLVSASAIGYYGNRGDERLNETSAAGSGYLAEVVRQWEEATTPASNSGIRTVLVRFGMVLSADGGALAKMLLPFRLGVGGRIGKGTQFWSWVSLDDAVGAIHHALRTDALSGPVNVVAPDAVTNAQFTRTLGQVLGRPTLLPMPTLAARLALGEMADELLLSSARVEPQRLQETGYRFRHPTLAEALRDLVEEEKTPDDPREKFA